MNEFSYLFGRAVGAFTALIRHIISPSSGVSCVEYFWIFVFIFILVVCAILVFSQ